MRSPPFVVVAKRGHVHMMSANFRIFGPPSPLCHCHTHGTYQYCFWGSPLPVWTSHLHVPQRHSASAQPHPTPTCVCVSCQHRDAWRRREGTDSQWVSNYYAKFGLISHSSITQNETERELEECALVEVYGCPEKTCGFGLRRCSL